MKHHALIAIVLVASFARALAASSTSSLRANKDNDVEQQLGEDDASLGLRLLNVEVSDKYLLCTYETTTNRLLLIILYYPNSQKILLFTPMQVKLMSSTLMNTATRISALVLSSHSRMKSMRTRI